jgi:hypothetical protein
LAETPEERIARVEHESLTACTPHDEEYDLGTGRAADIQVFAPRFFAFRPAGTRGPRTFAEADAMANQDKDGRSENARRLQALKRGGNDGFDIAPVNFEGASVANIKTTREPASGAIRAWFVGPEQLVMLITPSECPHVYAHDTCEDDQLVSKLSIRGTIPCVADQAVKSEHVWVAVQGADAAAVPLGKPALLRVRAPYGWERERDGLSIKLTAQVSRELNSGLLWTYEIETGLFTDPRPEEVLALLEPGTIERQAALGYRNLYRTTDEIDQQIVGRRVAAVKNQVSNIATPPQLIKLRNLLAIGQGMPGDTEVLGVLQPKQEALLLELVERGKRDRESFVLGAQLVEGMVTTSEPTAAQNRFFDAFGPLVVGRELVGEDVEALFGRVFARTKYAKALAEREQQEEAARTKVQENAEREDEIDSLWSELQTNGDQIAFLNHAIPFFTKYFHDPVNKAAVRRMSDHRALLLGESFCPGRARFIEAIGRDELRRRAQEHCETEPPTHPPVGRFDEVVLTKECKQVFESGCR